MADYKTIHGTLVRSYTTDPDNPIEGQVWYDKTNKVLQFQVPNVTTAGAWRTGNNMNTAKSSRVGGGTQTAGIVFGGEPATGITETYDGTSYTEVADMNTGRSDFGGNGTQTSALGFGGYSATAYGNFRECLN